MSQASPVASRNTSRAVLAGLLLALVAAGLWLAFGGAPADGGAQAAAAPADSRTTESASGADPVELTSPGPAALVEPGPARDPGVPEGEGAPSAAARPAAPAAPEALHALSGRVLDGFGNGVADQRVWVHPGEDSAFAVEADAQGRFRVTGLAAGPVRLEVDAGAIPQGWLPPPAEAVAIEVPFGGEVDLYLVGAALVSGRVRLVSGGRASGITLRAIPAQGVELPDPVGKTDANGEYEIAGLYPATYELTVVDLPDSVLARAGYPRPLVITPVEGETLRAPELVLGTGTAVVTGRILDAEGVPITDLPVTCYYGEVHAGSRERARAGSTSTDAGGLFRIEGLEPGSAHVVPADGRKAFVAEPVPVELAQGQAVAIPDQFLTRRGVADPNR